MISVYIPYRNLTEFEFGVGHGSTDIRAWSVGISQSNNNNIIIVFECLSVSHEHVAQVPRVEVFACLTSCLAYASLEEGPGFHEPIESSEHIRGMSRKCAHIFFQNLKFTYDFLHALSSCAR